jgi:hypothetical protein
MSVVNTCAHDTLLMALFWLREHDKSLGPLIRADRELLNVVLDNIKRKKIMRRQDLLGLITVQNVYLRDQQWCHLML